jgi:pilus assembly protein CpaB
VNPRQRRGALLLVASVVAAIAVFISVLAFIADVNSRAGNFIQVVTLARDVKAYQPITPQDVALKEIPEKWASGGAVRDARDIVGLVPLNDVTTGSFAERGMFIDRPGIATGNREIAILVDAETGVAGKVKSGDKVDIIATFDGKEDKSVPTSQLWAQNALVINVGLPSDVQETDARGGLSEGKKVPITFALPTPEALRVAYAESFSVKLRLALRARNDETTADPNSLIYTAPTQVQ